MYKAGQQNVLFLKENKKIFPQNLFRLVGRENLRVPYLVTSMNYFAELYIDSALVGLVGTARTSDVPVVYALALSQMSSSGC